MTRCRGSTNEPDPFSPNAQARDSTTGDSLRLAERAVLALHESGIDERALWPETELARTNTVVELEEFIPWYRVAAKSAFGRQMGFKPPTQEDCLAAYERYRRGRNDFY